MSQVPKTEVKAWIRELTHHYGVKSIICLLGKNHLRLYEELPKDLISYYERNFEVLHIPVPSRALLTKTHLKRVWKAYVRLKKPVLIHCSAGIGRTGKVVAHIRRKLKKPILLN